MYRLKLVALSVVASIACGFATAPDAFAQSSATSATASSSGQVRRAQRKAARKARRASKNAELRTLNKGNTTTTGGPRTLEGVETKRTSPAPASAP
ncbi:hypothetical protein PQQ96_21705 [Paraburkholderia sediminicola]|uniref:hypothetical protein n=1 Tax=Paraburkholderia sediminicola TaxID=458836 RepID=UPI0038BAAA7D